MRNTLLAVTGALAFVGSASAQVLEDFEHGNEALWVQQTAGDNMSLVGAAAHNGVLGAQFGSGSSGWRTRFDIPVGPGGQYYAYVRSGDGTTGRMYMGIGANAAGTFSAVAAPNTGTLILQQNVGYGFADVSSTAAAYAANTWYVLLLDWANNGDMTVSLYDETLTSLLASTPTFATGQVTPGGLALRGFSSTTFDIDTISRVVPAPAGALVLAGLAPLARRRRS